MSTSPNYSTRLPRGPDVLGELLHSLSQPLTSLQCSLELSIEEVAERQQESVAVALQQTEKVIGMIQLMREYVDAEQPGPEESATPLAQVLRSVVEALTSIAAVRAVELRMVGTCSVTVPVPESRLRMALQYLIAGMVDAQSGGKVTLLLGEDAAEAVLRVEGERGFRSRSSRDPNYQDREQSTANPRTNRDRAGETSGSTSTLRRVRLAIASRVLETAGAALVCSDGERDPSGFVLRVPRRAGVRE